MNDDDGEAGDLPNDDDEVGDLPDVAADEETGADAVEADPGGPDDELLGDVASRVRERRRSPDGDPTLDELFEEVDVGDVDSETLWRQVESEGPAFETATGPGEYVVDKATYCQKCEYFSGPPAVSCTYEGADVLEVVDTEHFRVRNCPVVAEEEDLETTND